MIRLLSALDPTIFAGHALDLANVPVRATTGRGLWVGFGPHSELFLAALHETQLVGIEAGGEKVYIEAAALTKLTPRPAT